MKRKKSHLRYHPLTDTYEIYGVRYAGALFKFWGKEGVPVGTLFRLVKREDGKIWVETVEEKEEEEDEKKKDN